MGARLLLSYGKFFLREITDKATINRGGNSVSLYLVVRCLENEKVLAEFPGTIEVIRWICEA